MIFESIFDKAVNSFDKSFTLQTTIDFGSLNPINNILNEYNEQNNLDEDINDNDINL